MSAKLWWMSLGMSAMFSCAVCGDGKVQKNEGCDDGNELDADGCEADCSLPACGNGIVDPGELCLQEQRFPMTFASNQIASGDLNDDGLPDVAISVPTNAVVTVFENQGNNTLTEQVFSLPLGIGPQDLLVNDLSGDGLLDLVTANQSTNNISVLLNAQNQPFTQEQVSASGGTEPLFIISKELNGQAGEDLIVLHNDGTNALFVLLNDGNGALAQSGTLVLADGEAPLRFSVEDVDNDGAQDVVVAGNAEKVSAFFGNGSGQFGPATVLLDLAPQLPGESILQVGAADLDGDGFPEVLATGQLGDLFVLSNGGDRTFTLAQTFEFALQGNGAFFVVDFDSNGILDFVSPRAQGGFDVCVGQGGGVFAAPVNFPTTNQVGEIVVVDLNEDSALDVAVLDGQTSELVIFFSEP